MTTVTAERTDAVSTGSEELGNHQLLRSAGPDARCYAHATCPCSSRCRGGGPGDGFCSVPNGAAAGIGVDANGDPVDYLQVRHDHIDGATIQVNHAHESGRRKIVPAATGFAASSPATRQTC